MDMTAVEIARELGARHLYSILSPIVRHSMPVWTLDALQHRFHNIIREDLGDRVEKEHLHLPQLSLLTELEVPEMHLPVYSALGRGDQVSTRVSKQVDELLNHGVGLCLPVGFSRTPRQKLWNGQFRGR